MAPKSLRRIFGRIAVLALLLPISWFASAQTSDSATINELLANAKSHAYLATDDAGTLESYTRSQLSWKSHALRLQTIKEHVNNLIKDVNELNSKRADGSPWQQEAIDRINPLLKEMADQLNTTIEHLNANPNRIQMQAYRDYVHANREVINRTHNMISDFLDYAEAKSKADSLEKALELPSETEGE